MTRTVVMVTKVCVVYAMCVSVAWVLPDRPPDCACVWTMPWHVPFTQPSTDPPPYTLNISDTRVLTNMTVTMLLVGKTPAEGFLVQVHDPSGNTLGAFTPTPGLVQTMTCKRPNDTATHVSNKKNMMVTFQWQPPSDYNGQAFFKATVVRTYSTFWTGITSNTFNVSSS
ncbi:putative defense protein Hdd11-like isoform X1 [Procambarus clarkii]|uniref:putative defense protein Hdd11-like isoform X1 n=2 Tax=Procambarus clarkii TaxID=6728 RepID=UPI001E674785|nr:putative defense protein Hdd11-like isoform X1 [Procambarus clarkii]XP_045623214.1 putative defense protein Hdd11-like isoform X1 [Procambarus clarkii]